MFIEKTAHIIQAILAFIAIFVIFIQRVEASGTFPELTCEDPIGNVKVHYDDGIHGVPGITKTFRGMDTVYQVDGNNILLQCLCTRDGEGIQTDWKKATDMSAEKVKEYVRNGWIEIPNGALWGLDSGKYLAKNSEWQCVEEEVVSLPATGIAGTQFPQLPQIAIVLGMVLMIIGITLSGKQLFKNRFA